MRSITLISALAATLQVLSSNALAAGGWTWPVRGPVITAYRNGDDPYAAGQHRGIDIGAPVGTRVVAAVGGTVTFVGVVGSSGLTVSERSADGRFDLSYLHLSSAAVHRGEAVAAGAALGAVGTTGRRSAEAPHLHFGVREAGSRSAYRDPLDFLSAPPTARSPEPAPAPVPAAHPARAEPAPAGAPAAPAAAHVPAPLAHPGGSPAGSVHRAAVHGAPQLAAAALPALLTHRGPAGTPARPDRASSARHGDAHPGALHPAWRGPTAATHLGAPAHAAPHAKRRANARDHGINLGWLAACFGLIAAATALGRPDAARRLAVRGRARFDTLLRPASRGS
ncbi:MAG: hypothetical protein QOH76_520 [Thermoleophilaceae bacterium]|jgi:hypothetical protein|nr:hypothetical protein [Thermoleophilaceae bacterium]